MADDTEKLRFENIFGAMSLALVDKLERAYEADIGLGPSSVAALIQIGAGSGLTIETLRRIIGLSHSASVRLIDQLEAAGLVLRSEPVDGDRRAKALKLTEAGRALYGRCKEARRGVTERAFAVLDPDEMQLFGRLAEKVLPALVNLGADQDVVCRVCDESVCVRARCPISHMK